MGSVAAAAAMVSEEAGLVAARSDCSERHVEKMLPKAVCGDCGGGLAGGDAKRVVWRRVKGGSCEESHESADGSSMAFFLLYCALRGLSSDGIG
jgi:hypothetical protein